MSTPTPLIRAWALAASPLVAESAADKLTSLSQIQTYSAMLRATRRRPRRWHRGGSRTWPVELQSAGLRANPPAAAQEVLRRRPPRKPVGSKGDGARLFLRCEHFQAQAPDVSAVNGRARGVGATFCRASRCTRRNHSAAPLASLRASIAATSPHAAHYHRNRAVLVRVELDRLGALRC